MEGSEDYQSMQQAISAHLVATTRSAGQLAAEDLDFLRASDKKAGKRVDRKNGQLLEVAQQLIESSTAGTSLVTPSLKKASQIDESWRTVADVIDNLLERADRCLDEYTGVITRLKHDKEPKTKEGTSSKREGRLPKSHPLEKPQLRFRTIPKNDETTPFKPLLTSKPHAVVPLEQSLSYVVESATESGQPEYEHPYEREIADFKYPASVYSHGPPTAANDDPEGKTLTWVDTLEKVSEMLEELKQAKEIAVDLEHHDAHSYVGIVCLMQISTREKDWIVDTLKPWREDLQMLNEVFTDPQILKVFHGSAMDMVWLQRDLGIYVVGLFDTYHATNALQYPRHGLAYLLKKFENFDAQKQYQMADWRVRPLGKELIQYARSDTHFLLHIYDCIRNELVEQSTPQENLVDYVLEKSKMEALRRYERFIYDAELGRGASGWLTLLMRTPAPLTRQQFAVFKAVHQLRDQIARRTDESLLVVMRNDTIFAIARTMPEQMPELLGVVHPVSQFMQPKMSELLGVVKKAKASGENGPSVDETMSKPEVVEYMEKVGSWKWKQAERKKAQANSKAPVTPALADIIRAEREKAENAPSVAEASTFWGSMLDSSDLSNAVCELRLTVPMPDATADAAHLTHSKIAEEAASSPEKMEASGAHEPTPPKDSVKTAETQESSTFSIKELKRQGRKRKAEQEVHEPQATNESTGESLGGNTIVDDVVDMDDNGHIDVDAAPESDRSKKSRKKSNVKTEEKMLEETMGDGQPPKKSKKERKELKEQKKAKEAEERKARQEAEPFDYANTPNILEGASANDRRKEAKKQKGFDPYAKSLDTPKGLPRRTGGGTGKSKTFKG